MQRHSEYRQAEHRQPAGQIASAIGYAVEALLAAGASLTTENLARQLTQAEQHFITHDQEEQSIEVQAIHLLRSSKGLCFNETLCG